MIIDIFFIKVFTLSKRLEPNTFIILMCFIYSILSYYSISNKPYDINKYPELNRIETLFVLFQASLCWKGSLILSLYGHLSSEDLSIINFLFFAYVIIGNIFLAGFWLFKYWGLNMKQKVSSVMAKLRKTLRPRSTTLSNLKVLNKTKALKFNIQSLESLKEEGGLLPIKENLFEPQIFGEVSGPERIKLFPKYNFY